MGRMTLLCYVVESLFLSFPSAAGWAPRPFKWLGDHRWGDHVSKIVSLAPEPIKGSSEDSRLIGKIPAFIPFQRLDIRYI